MRYDASKYQHLYKEWGARRSVDYNWDKFLSESNITLKDALDLCHGNSYFAVDLMGVSDIEVSHGVMPAKLVLYASDCWLDQVNPYTIGFGLENSDSTNWARRTR